MDKTKEKKNNQQPKPQDIPKKAIPLSKAGLWISGALIIGFIGGIWFGDHAQKKVGSATFNLPVDMEMPNETVQRGMAPGPVNINTQQAIQKMEEILVSDPNNLQMRIHLGNLYYDLDNPKKAIENYEKALTIDKKNPDVLTDCAVMYREIKATDKALAYLKSATQLSPSHYQSWNNLGIVYREDLKEYQNAIDTWNQLLKNMPGNPHAQQIQEEINKTKILLAK